MMCKKCRKKDLANLVNVDKIKDVASTVSDFPSTIKDFAKDEIVTVEKKVTKKKTGGWKKVLGIVLVIVGICAVVYALIKYFKPEYEDEFMDDIDDEFYDDDDELFDDEDDVTDEAD